MDICQLQVKVEKDDGGSTRSDEDCHSDDRSQSALTSETELSPPKQKRYETPDACYLLCQ